MRIKENTEKRFKQRVKNKFLRCYAIWLKLDGTHAFRDIGVQINVYLNLPVKDSFFWKGIQQSGLVIDMMIQKNLKSLERMEVFIKSHPIWRFFLAMVIMAIYILLGWNFFKKIVNGVNVDTKLT